MVTSSTPMPIPAMKRQASRLAAVWLSAIAAVVRLYQRRERVKMVRRPK